MRTLSMLLLALSAGCCTPRHVMLRTGEVGTGSLFVCVQTGTQYTCDSAEDERLAYENLSGTLYIDLPKACQGRFRQILLQDFSSGKPRALVKCAPPENKLSTTHDS